MHPTQTLVGLELDSYAIESLICDGSFSRLYLGFNSSTNARAVFKVGKSTDEMSRSQHDSGTQAICIFEGAVTIVRPFVDNLMEHQLQRMVLARLGSFIGRTELREQSGTWYYIMDYCESPTLRQVLDTPGVPCLQSLLLLCDCFEKLVLRDKTFVHGDLKPEHVFISLESYGAQLIDPGYFGPMHCVEGNNLDCAITTPTYSPFLKADDLFSFGIIFWEAVCKQHPLIPKHDVTDLCVGESVLDWVRAYESVGQYFLTPIVQLQRPTTIRPELPPTIERMLLKGLRLQLSADGLIERGPGFESFSEWKQELQGLIAQGITHL